eukprot:TRINITY_DN5532_c0_g1_i7.p2 TRINITY_DN5532_c0_g1~~TRINITY_DN5532_c0_g1_i7.p2  ORF type:complete len:218 (-),score=51.18 TRINITY_DN5532_c0_g1_i7:187-840(-)
MGGYVYIFPTINVPFLKHQQDQTLLLNLLNFNGAGRSETQLNIATGYMNFSEKIVKELLNSKNKINLLTASPMANGFYNGGTFKKYIPYFYRVYEYLLQKEMKKQGKTNISIHEYARGHWTFHSKGIWIAERGEETPSLTMIGSSNMSERSFSRDTELNLYMYSQCPMFKEDLQEEVFRQFAHAQNVTDKDLKRDPEMKLTLFKIIMAEFFSSYLQV